jgi:hypothetical protein
MAFPDWVQGARRPSPLITFYREGSTTPEPLTGATITGTLTRGGTTTAITGACTVTDGAGGIFRYDPSAADVAVAGAFRIQFTAAFPSGQTPARTFWLDWHIREAY